MTRWVQCFCFIALLACSRDADVKNVVPAYVGDSQCSGCTISVVELGVVGNDSLRPTLDARLATDGDSLIAVAPLQGRGAIGVFAFNGALRRQLPLPPEWRTVSALEFLDEGLLAIMSEQRTRVLTLSLDGKVDREVSVPPNTHRFLSSANALIVNAELRTGDGLGFPLHLLTDDGKVAKSFGAKDETVVPREENHWRRRLALSRSGSVWSANPDTYKLELWNTRGILLRQLQRKSPWWDSTASGANPARFATEKPQAELISMWEDSTGLLWTQLKVAAREWHPLSQKEIARRHDAPFQLGEYDEFFDTVIEVIDPAKGTLLASARFPGAVGLLLRGNVYAKWTQSGTRSYALRLVRLSLNGRTGFPPSRE